MPPEQFDAVSHAEEVQRLSMDLLWYEQRQFAQELTQTGLTVPQFVTMSVLHDTGTQSPMGGLAEMVRQCSATMTGIVDRLVRLGLVQRMRSDEDRRSVLVGLTPKGEELLREVKTGRRARMQRILSRMSPEVRQQVVPLLRAYLQATLAEDGVQDA